MAIWVLPDTLRPNRQDLSLSTSLLSRKMVHHCSTLYVSVSRTSVLPNGTKSLESNASRVMTLQKQISKSEPRTTRGSHQVVQHRQPTDSVAFFHCKEACIHVDTWIHAMLDIAIQLPWQRLLPSNNGAANSAGEEQTDLLCATQGTSVQVQRFTWLFATLTMPKVKNKITMMIWIHLIRWI